MLPLAEVEEGHHGGFFVLRGVAFEDFGDELLVDFIEFEEDAGVVVWGVAVLRWCSQYQLRLGVLGGRERTTWRASLATRVVVVRVRHWGGGGMRDWRAMRLVRQVSVLEAITKILWVLK